MCRASLASPYSDAGDNCRSLYILLGIAQILQLDSTELLMLLAARVMVMTAPCSKPHLCRSFQVLMLMTSCLQGTEVEIEVGEMKYITSIHL